LAVMHARGEIGVDEKFIHESIIGTKFVGRIRNTLDISGRPGIVPNISGRGWVTGFHTHVLDATDPLPTGYRLSDTWPVQPT
jgi:proline racemase